MLEQDLIKRTHAEVDGENTPDQRRALLQLLEESDEAKTLYHDLLALERIIPTLKADVSPVDLAEAVEAAIVETWRSKDYKSSPKPSNVVKMSSSSFSAGKIAASIAVLLVVIAAVVYLSTGLVQPDPSQVAGTAHPDTSGIQKASRFRQSQITDGDVILENEQFQKVLQSDEFIKLVQSGTLTELSNNALFAALFSNPQAMEVLSDVRFSFFISNPELLKAMSEPMLQAALNNPSFMALLQNETFQQLASNPELTNLASNAEFQQLMASDTFQELGASAAFQSLIADDLLLKFSFAMSQSDLQSMSSVAELLASVNFASFNNPETLELMASAQFAALFNNPDFQTLMNNPDFQSMMSAPEFHQLLQQESFLKALAP